MEYKILGDSKIGKNCIIQENVIIGAPFKGLLKVDKDRLPGAIIGDDCIIRTNSVIYSDAKIGNKFRTGHNVLIREDTTIGNNVLIGTNSIVEDNCIIGNNVSIQSNVYIPTNTRIMDCVFIGPNACLTNDKYPAKVRDILKGPTLERHVTIGANATILPAVVVGEGSVVGAGAVVTKDINPWKLAVGVPAREADLPDNLKVLNKI